MQTRSCSDTRQHTRYFAEGETVAIQGSGHRPGDILPWTITGTAASAHPRGVVARGVVQANVHGEFCVQAHTIARADAGEYAVNVAGGTDTYRVDRLKLSATATAELHTYYAWTVEKTASPARIDLFEGDEAVARFDVAVERSIESQEHAVSGSLIVTSASSVPSARLDVFACVEHTAGGDEWTRERFCPPVERGVAIPARGTLHVAWGPAGFVPAAHAVGYRAAVQLRAAGSDEVIHEVVVPFEVRSTPTSANAESVSFVAGEGAEPVQLSGSASFSYGVTYGCEAGSAGGDVRVARLEAADFEVVSGATVDVRCHTLDVAALAPAGFAPASTGPLLRVRSPMEAGVAARIVELADATLRAQHTVRTCQVSGLVVSFPHLLRPGDELVCSYASLGARPVRGVMSAAVERQPQRFLPDGRAIALQGTSLHRAGPIVSSRSAAQYLHGAVSLSGVPPPLAVALGD